MEYKDFHELEIWRIGYGLLMGVYNSTQSFPACEQYTLASQICRSANSVIANIAESHGRYSYADKIRVLNISRGEILETRSHITVAYGQRYITKSKFVELNSGYKQLTKKLNLYIKNLQTKK